VRNLTPDQVIPSTRPRENFSNIGGSPNSLIAGASQFLAIARLADQLRIFLRPALSSGALENPVRGWPVYGQGRPKLSFFLFFGCAIKACSRQGAGSPLPSEGEGPFLSGFMGREGRGGIVSEMVIPFPGCILLLSPCGGAFPLPACGERDQGGGGVRELQRRSISGRSVTMPPLPGPLLPRRRGGGAAQAWW
jgi:hypothetical protein